ncbi:hypothetical protein O181_088391 [Austropuccinia psidii MF-1]|uniref:Reverse transcriptase Ty1/copia-type domain-containing protein n=1 Tax=Austropuccinia psidii MF-1 TaxID=1389203 RepID=A0A9Q3P6X2_9BASI|nr:hypothetical protein [Austropuccinia psidii MF-1]
MLGIAHLILGIKIIHQPDSFTLTQSHYINFLLDSYGMSNCKPVATPLIPIIHLEPATELEKKVFQLLKINYQSAIGSLIYLSTTTRLDMSYSISALSQFLENPGIMPWNLFLHVLKYLKGTSKFGLRYQKDLEKPIVAYSDEDWGNCTITGRSTTGYLIKINDNLVILNPCKQPNVSLSSSEA